MSRRNDDPESASRPFDKGRDGFVMGEGAGVVVLEGLDHARGRGARIYAEAAGYGNAADAYHLTAPDPQGDGMIRVMRLALADAGLKPEDVGYINAHGTSTILNDSRESAAIQAVFGPQARRLKVSSTKSMIGHLLAAAGGRRVHRHGHERIHGHRAPDHQLPGARSGLPSGLCSGPGGIPRLEGGAQQFLRLRRRERLPGRYEDRKRTMKIPALDIGDIHVPFPLIQGGMGVRVLACLPRR
jgi:hypothetical protein